MQCETCGNDYDKPMRIELSGKTHVFDSFECAIFRLAPHCVATFGFWDTAWKKRAGCTAAPTVPMSPAFPK